MKIKHPLVFIGLFITIFLSILLNNPFVASSQANITDLSRIFGNTTGAFFLYNPQDNQYIYYIVKDILVLEETKQIFTQL